MEAEAAISPSRTKPEVEADGVELWAEVCPSTSGRYPYQEGWKAKNWEIDKERAERAVYQQPVLVSPCTCIKLFQIQMMLLYLHTLYFILNIRADICTNMEMKNQIEANKLRRGGMQNIFIG